MKKLKSALLLSMYCLQLPLLANAASTSVHIEQEQRSNAQLKQNNYRSSKLGINYWSPEAAAWAGIEMLQASDDQLNRGNKNKLYGDVAGEFRLQDWVFAPSLALGSDARYRADQSVQVQVRYTGMKQWWPYLGAASETYETDATSTYLYQRAGSFILLPVPGLLANLYVQTIDLQATGPVNLKKQGNGFTAGLSYYGEQLTMSGTVQRNCISDSYACDGRLRDYYAEYAVRAEWRLNTQWSLGGAIGVIEQKSENLDLPLSSLTTDANYAKLLLRHHL